MSSLYLNTADVALLVGAAGAGKSTTVAKLVGSNTDWVVSSDAIREELTGDAADQSANGQVWPLFYERIARRAKAGLPVVIDATNVTAKARAAALAAVAPSGRNVVAVRVQAPLNVVLRRNASRDRVVPEDVVRRMFLADAELTGAQLRTEGFAQVVSAEQVAGMLPFGVHGETVHGPFDVIGDVHGQYDALIELLTDLGYRHTDDGPVHRDGRLPVFVGDIVDKGPESLRTLRYVMRAHRAGLVLAVAGNHEIKLSKVLVNALRESGSSTGKLIRSLNEAAAAAKFGLASTLREIVADTDLLTGGLLDVIRWIGELPNHLVLDESRIVVVHASMRPDLIGADTFPSNNAKNRAEGLFFYGPTNGERDPETGFPVRLDWAGSWDSDTVVVHGHVVQDNGVTVRGNVVSVDTGAGEGLSLSAYQWPEQTTVTVDIVPATALVAI